eukprot:Selendium_serpulae@DN5466_c0_g1_i3.p1
MSDKKQVLSTPQRSRDESEQKDGRSAPCDPPEPFHPNSGNNIIVSTRQKGNFVTGHIRNVPFEYANILPDFLIGKVDCALFISLQYHRLHPLLCLADLPADDCEAALLQVSQIAVQHNLSLLLAWSFEEAGRILETMKAFENKPADLIRGQMEIQQRGRMIEVLTTVGAVNKTDAVTLISQFGTMENIFKATKGDLLQCPGMGSRKVNNLLEAINEPFFDAAKMRHN